MWKSPYRHGVGALLAALWCAAAGAGAADYPVRPLRMVSPFAPGGATEPIARMIGQGLMEKWGQPVVLDFRPGAGTLIGTDIVRTATPDGHTLLIVAASFAINPHLYRDVKYDPIRDFMPVTMEVEFPFLLTVHPASPARDAQQLIGLAKAQPGRLTFSSSGIGNTNHLAGELMKRMAGIDITHVPYKGGGPALTAVIGGEISMLFTTVLSSLPHVQSGRLRALAISSAERSRFLPGVPPLAEAARLPGFDVKGWYGLVVHAATPRPVVQALNREIVAILGRETVKQRIVDSGVDPWPTTPEAARQFIAAESIRWRNVITELRLRPE
jgi:tripartite-type tricarboxylate transporter receptor subunit TctC